MVSVYSDQVQPLDTDGYIPPKIPPIGKVEQIFNPNIKYTVYKLHRVYIFGPIAPN